MNTAILIVWWVGLVGALIATLLILKEVTLVIRTLTDIRQLATRTAAAARGVAEHVAPVPALAGTIGSGEPLIQAAQHVRTAAVQLEQSIKTHFSPSHLQRLSRWVARWIKGIQGE